MTKKNDKLSKAELTVMAQLLETAANEFADHSDYNYALPASPENKDFFRRVIITMTDEADQEEALLLIEEEKDELLTTNGLLYDYFAQRCQKLASKK
jgi:hypothetical protein